MAEHSLRAAAYPVLDAEQIAAVAHCAGAVLQTYRAGQFLFQQGERDFKFFIIVSGEVEIRDESGETPVTIIVHEPGEFTGDVAHLTGHPSIVSAIARTDAQVYEISADALQRLINKQPDLGDVILQAFIARRELLQELGSFTGMRMIGSRYSRDTSRIRDFLSKNRILFKWLDLDSNPEVERLLHRFGLRAEDTPVVAWGRKLLLRNPSNSELASALGIRRPLEKAVYDLAIVGAGPAGLAAAVYGASEGLKTVVFERTAPGGQAGSSMRIENYLGFPTGISGRDLADRAVLQADKFGARLSIADPVTGLTFSNTYAVLQFERGETVASKCLLIATGADYRRLPAEGCERFEGCGIYYAATPNEAQLCRGSEVVVVGGGNSAGQAAVYLSGQASKVYLVVRETSLYDGMSAYLAKRIEDTENIEVLLNTEVLRMTGNGCLATIEIVNRTTNENRSIKTAALFSFISAIPRTEWLPTEIETNASGYIHTGSAVTPASFAKRQPYLLETSQPGVFAAGDVRAGSIKRLASAVGEGAMAVQFVHEYLKEK